MVCVDLLTRDWRHAELSDLSLEVVALELQALPMVETPKLVVVDGLIS